MPGYVEQGSLIIAPDGISESLSQYLRQNPRPVFQSLRLKDLPFELLRAIVEMMPMEDARRFGETCKLLCAASQHYVQQVCSRTFI